VKKYRRLPGNRRGFLHSATMWLGADHLLAVQSMRFREEYKRFYLRDIQAIVVADAPRFHLSTRAAAAVVLWFAAWLALREIFPWTSPVWIAFGIGLAGAWLYVSANCSCTCRIYTAVSRDEIRSVYRRWTARRFLNQVEPKIAEVQGVLEGDWPGALENRDVGPPGSTLAPAVQTLQAANSTPARTRTLVSDLFIGSLLADALAHTALLVSSSPLLQWTGYALNIVQLAAACAIFVQASRRRLQPAMQKLAIATLLTLGALYYARSILGGIAGTNMFDTPLVRILHEVEIGANVVLAMVGLAILLNRSGQAGEA
jgi:hypothetical protein